MIKKSFLIIILIFSLSGCGVIKELTNLSRLQFKLANLESIKLGGININNKRSLKDFSSIDV